MSATQAGVALIPLSLGVSLGALGAGQLAARLGRYKAIVVVANLVLLVAAWLLTTLGPDTPYAQVVWIMVVAGVGIGPGLPLFTLAIQNAVDPRKVGQATSAAQFFRQIGGALGTAVMGTVLATSLAASFAQLPAAAEGSIDSASIAAEATPVPTGDVVEAVEGVLGPEAGAALSATVIEEGVRAAFAHAIGRIIAALVWVVAAAAVATLWLPSLELRGGARAAD